MASGYYVNIHCRASSLVQNIFRAFGALQHYFWQRPGNNVLRCIMAMLKYDALHRDILNSPRSPTASIFSSGWRPHELSYARSTPWRKPGSAHSAGYNRYQRRQGIF